MRWHRELVDTRAAARDSRSVVDERARGGSRLEPHCHGGATQRRPQDPRTRRTSPSDPLRPLSWYFSQMKGAHNCSRFPSLARSRTDALQLRASSGPHPERAVLRLRRSGLCAPSHSGSSNRDLRRLPRFDRRLSLRRIFGSMRFPDLSVLRPERRRASGTTPADEASQTRGASRSIVDARMTCGRGDATPRPSRRRPRWSAPQRPAGMLVRFAVARLTIGGKSSTVGLFARARPERTSRRSSSPAFARSITNGDFRADLLKLGTSTRSRRPPSRRLIGVLRPAPASRAR